MGKRGLAVVQVKGCGLCTDWTGGHQQDKCMELGRTGKPFQQCSIKTTDGQVCGKKHHPQLHGAKVQGLNHLYEAKLFSHLVWEMHSRIVLHPAPDGRGRP